MKIGGFGSKFSTLHKYRFVTTVSERTEALVMLMSTYLVKTP